MVGQPAVRLLLQTQKVRNDPPAIGAGGFSYFVKVRMITYLRIKTKEAQVMLNENIKNLRKAKGLSQEELAVKLNVVRQTVSKWEKGGSLR